MHLNSCQSFRTISVREKGCEASRRNEMFTKEKLSSLRPRDLFISLCRYNSKMEHLFSSISRGSKERQTVFASERASESHLSVHPSVRPSFALLPPPTVGINYECAETRVLSLITQDDGSQIWSCSSHSACKKIEAKESENGIIYSRMLPA